MKIAITGGTGFVGRNIARLLASEGHELVLIARGQDKTDPEILQLPRARFVSLPLDKPNELSQAFTDQSVG
jgi:nucleoside-diphosphate-sugar epimerase